VTFSLVILHRCTGPTTGPTHTVKKNVKMERSPGGKNGQEPCRRQILFFSLGTPPFPNVNVVILPPIPPQNSALP